MPFPNKKLHSEPKPAGSPTDADADAIDTVSAADKSPLAAAGRTTPASGSTGSLVDTGPAATRLVAVVPSMSRRTTPRAAHSSAEDPDPSASPAPAGAPNPNHARTFELIPSTEPVGAATTGGAAVKPGMARLNVSLWVVAGADSSFNAVPATSTDA